MTDMQSSLNQVGAITQAMLDALNQIEQYVAASQIGPDGNPSQQAIYMHMPIGYPIDPKMFANAWTPGGGDASASFSNDGTFVTPAPAPAGGSGGTATAAAPGGGSGPQGSVYPPPKATPDQQLQASIQSAFFTSALVDNMLEVTQKGVAASWPERRVSVEYYTILEGAQPLQTGPPAPDVVAAVQAAQKLLYLQDTNGNFVGYTPLYAQYRRNRKAWTDAIGAQAAAYAKAMSDPIAGQAWPVEAETYANDVTAALNDFNSMGRKQVEDALNTIATVGENAVTALVAMAKQFYDAYSIQLGGSISANVPWSYISPISWWDHTDESFGVQKITGQSSSYTAGGASGSSSFANNWWSEQSSSMSASAGVSVGFASASADYSHADASNAFEDHSGRSGWSNYSDKSSSATVTLEYFLATIERPWLFGDLFNIAGWYLVGQKKNSISDGNVATQVGDDKKLLPMIPKAFLIIRNLSITADDWGDAGNSFDNAVAQAAGSGQSSSNSVGVSASYLCYSGSFNAANHQASGAFGQSASSNSGWTWSRSQNGGTLALMGSQIAGWVGEIQPAAPQIDAPTIPSVSGTIDGSSTKSTTTGSTATTGSTPSTSASTPAAGGTS
ncbi:MAG: hypothetical protein NVSMB64_02500 [Candidatus Velthaea sp.]